MQCRLINVSGSVFACRNKGCGRILKIETRKPSSLKFRCKGTSTGRDIDDDLASRAKAIASVDVNGVESTRGPGAEFRKTAESFGFTQVGCACAATEARMNRLGPDGCRREIESLIDEVMANARKMAKPMTRGLARHAIEEACRRAELANASGASI